MGRIPSSLILLLTLFQPRSHFIIIVISILLHHHNHHHYHHHYHEGSPSTVSLTTNLVGVSPCHALCLQMPYQGGFEQLPISS